MIRASSPSAMSLRAQWCALELASMATMQPAGSCTHHSMNLSRASARARDHAAGRVHRMHLDHALGQIHPYSNRFPRDPRVIFSMDFPFHRLEIDDFEHHQSWRIVAVARRWEVPSHSHRADVQKLASQAFGRRSCRTLGRTSCRRFEHSYSSSSAAAPESAPSVDPFLDYEQVVHLDADDLAEQGIKSAYTGLLPQLLHYTTTPLEVTEETGSLNLAPMLLLRVVIAMRYGDQRLTQKMVGQERSVTFFRITLTPVLVNRLTGFTLSMVETISVACSLPKSSTHSPAKASRILPTGHTSQL